METWDYAVLTMTPHSDGTASSFWTEVGTGQAEGVAPEQWYDRIAQAGREGWELVTISGGNGGETMHFKRIRP